MAPPAAPPTKLEPFIPRRVPLDLEAWARSTYWTQKPCDTQGLVAVPLEKVARRLGRPAMLVYGHFLRCRDEHGITHITRAGLYRRTGLQQCTVKDVVARLRDVGLALDVTPGFFANEPQVKTLPEGGEVVWGVRVYNRLILGMLTPVTKGVWVVHLPPHVAAWLDSPRGWGGKREGSGRPKGARDVTPRKVREPKIKYPPPMYIGERTKHTAPVCLLSVADATSKEQTVPCGTQLVFEKQTPVPDAPSTPPEAPPALVYAPGEDADWGRTPPKPPGPPPPLVPPFPGHHVVNPATIPAPRKLGAELTDVGMVKVMLRLYRTAMEAEYGQKCMVLARGDVTKSKLFPGLLACAQKLRDEEVAPAYWIRFSIDFWKAYGPEGRRDKPPTLGFVFSPKRLEERWDWFTSDAYAAGRGRALLGKNHKLLLSTWARMNFALQRRPLASQEAVKGIVAGFFPGNRYQELVDLAKGEATAYRERLQRMAERGLWLWS